jgi:hypothetical protein
VFFADLAARRVASRYVLEFDFLGIQRGFPGKRAAERLRDEIAARLRGNDFDAGDERHGDESVEPSGAYYLTREEIAIGSAVASRSATAQVLSETSRDPVQQDV